MISIISGISISSNIVINTSMASVIIVIASVNVIVITIIMGVVKKIEAGKQQLIHQ